MPIRHNRTDWVGLTQNAYQILDCSCNGQNMSIAVALILWNILEL